jgi:serine acetyltransferase
VITDVPDNTTIMGVPARIRLRRAPLKTAEVKKETVTAQNGIPARRN